MGKIRVWKEIDSKSIDKELLICDDINAYCNACRHMGIALDAQQCPECKTPLHYITTREGHTSPNGMRILHRMLTQSGNKSVIDYNDYKHASDKTKVKNLFSN